MGLFSDSHSFVILAYRESQYLSQCIESLRNQTVKSEIILSTSTPSPYLKNIASRYKIPYMINPAAEGIASDWTYALGRASTPFVTLAHQDDIYLPHYTESSLRVAEKQRDSLIIFTSYAEIANNEERCWNVNLAVKRLILLPFFLIKTSLASTCAKKVMLSFGSPICCPSVMYNRDTIGDFSFSRDFRINMDWDAWLRMAEIQGSFIYVRKKLMLHRIHQESETTAGLYNNSRQEEDARIFRRIWPSPLAKIITYCYSKSYISNSAEEPKK